MKKTLNLLSMLKLMQFFLLVSKNQPYNMDRIVYTYRYHFYHFYFLPRHMQTVTIFMPLSVSRGKGLLRSAKPLNIHSYSNASTQKRTILKESSIWRTQQLEGKKYNYIPSGF